MSSTFVPNQTSLRNVAADLSDPSHYGKFVTNTSTGFNLTTAGGRPDGVHFSNEGGASDGETFTPCKEGEFIEVIAGENIPAGSPVASGAGGLAAVATTGDFVRGIAETTAAGNGSRFTLFVTGLHTQA
jgi:hypothetical protein